MDSMTDFDRGSSQQPRLSQGPSAVRKGARALPTYRNDANFGRASGKVMNLGSIEKDGEGFEPFGPYLQDDIWHSPPPTIQPAKPKPKPKPKPAVQPKKPTRPLFNDDDDDVFTRPSDGPSQYVSQPKAAPKPAPRKLVNPPKPAPKPAAYLDDDDEPIPEPAPRKKSTAALSSQTSTSRNKGASQPQSQPVSQRAATASEKGKGRALSTIQEDEDVDMDVGNDDSNMSFASVVDEPNRDDDDSGNEGPAGDDMDVDDTPPPQSKKFSPIEAGRSRDHEEENQPAVEEEQYDDGGNFDYDMQPPEEEEQQEDEEPAETPRSRRTRLAQEKKEAKKAKERERKEQAAAARKERQPLKAKDQNVVRKRITSVEGSDEDSADDGVRRSKRAKFSPLEWWRGEHVTRRRPKPGEPPLPILDKIVRIPEDEKPKPRSTKSRRRGTTKPPSSRGPSKKTKEAYVEDPGSEDGLDADTEQVGVVLDFETRLEVEKVIAQTDAMLDPQKPMNADYAFQKVFTDGEFVAGGVLEIPPGGRKPSKPARDNTYIFYCIEGAVRVQVHKSHFVISRKGMFLVPRGNQYYLENIADKTCRLFFAQARKVAEKMIPSPTKRATPSGSRTLSHTPSRPGLPSAASSGSPTKSSAPVKKPPAKKAGRS